MPDEHERPQGVGHASTIEGPDAPPETDDIDELFRRAAAEQVDSFPFGLTDRYVPRQKIATGATASVWHAFDTKVKRDVALKIFDRGNRSLEQVLAEAHAACAIRSEFTVQVLDVLDVGRPVIVMDLIGEYEPNGDIQFGRSADFLKPVSLDEAVRWCIDAASGVHAAHLRAVSHRDMKPANILVTPVSRRARVADFGLGIASLRADARSHATVSLRVDNAERPLHIAGTPAYMAPEQAAGVPLDLDMRFASDRRDLVRIDVFGLGALAYELILGRAPYVPGPNDDTLDVFNKARRSERPPIRALRNRWKRRTPRRLARVLEKALSADPLRRHESAEALAEDLRRFSEKRRTSLDSLWWLPWLWARRNPALVTFFVVACSLGVLFYLARVERDSHMRRMDLLEHQTKELAEQRRALQQEMVVAERQLAEARSATAQQRSELDRLQADVEAARQFARMDGDQLRASLKAANKERQSLRKENAEVRNENYELRVGENVLSTHLAIATEEARQLTRSLQARSREYAQAVETRDGALAALEKCDEAKAVAPRCLPSSMPPEPPIELRPRPDEGPHPQEQH